MVDRRFMKNIIIKKFDDILTQHKFVKYRKNYYRILNNSIFQIIGFVKCNEKYSVCFQSIPLMCDKVGVEELKFSEKYFEGFELSEIMNIESNSINKQDAYALITEEMIDKLDKLIDVQGHIEYYNKELFVANNQCGEAPYYYYLYVNDYKSAILQIEDSINEMKAIIAKLIVDEIIEKEDPLAIRQKDYFQIEDRYFRLKWYNDLLREIKNNQDFSNIFTHTYNSNIENLIEYFGKKLFLEIGGKNV